MFTTALDCVSKRCRVCGFRGDAFSLRAPRPLRKFPEGLGREGISGLKLRSLVVTWVVICRPPGLRTSHCLLSGHGTPWLCPTHPPLICDLRHQGGNVSASCIFLDPCPSSGLLGGALRGRT